MNKAVKKTALVIILVTGVLSCTAVIMLFLRPQRPSVSHRYRDPWLVESLKLKTVHNLIKKFSKTDGRWTDPLENLSSIASTQREKESLYFVSPKSGERMKWLLFKPGEIRVNSFRCLLACMPEPEPTNPLSALPRTKCLFDDGVIERIDSEELQKLIDRK
jgi:hypothetical protein